jgi:hypothetical protein
MFQTEVVEKIKMHFMFSNFFFFENLCVVYEIMWKNVVDWGRPQMPVWRMRIACWIPKATNTHTLTICSNCCFSTATMVGRTRHIVTLYVYVLPVLLQLYKRM